nr:hypothetical protein [Tanacetum cinerariifolium]
MCKLLEGVRIIREELVEYINSLSWNHPTFYDNDEEHSIQYKEYLEKSSNAIAPVLPTEEPEYSLSMGYEHLSTISETESDEVIKSSVKNLVPILSECEATSDNESECDVLVCEDSFDVLKDHSDILSDSNNDDTSSNDDAFEDIEYVEASILDSELSSSSFLILEKSDNSLSYSDHSLPEFENFSDHTEETRRGSTTAHANNSLHEVMPKVLSQAWERFSEIKHAFTDKQYQPKEIQELMCKLLEGVRIIREELAEYINSLSWNHPTFYDNDEEHSIQ